MNTKQLLELVIRPALNIIGLGGRAAEELLLGTCAQESHMGEYIAQINGPALGIYQMEPATHEDIWGSYLQHRKTELLRQPVRSLIYDLSYSTAMCRYHYLRVKEPLPGVGDLNGQAEYWKKYYNTSKGRGTVLEYVKNYERYVAGKI